MAHEGCPTQPVLSAIGSLVEAEYDLRVLSVQPVILGVNRTFEIRTVSTSYFFRICRELGRSLDDLRAEAAITAAARDDALLGVARAVPKTDGTYVLDCRELGDRARYGLLFQQAQGREPRLCDRDLRCVGRALARLHAQPQLAGLAPGRRLGDFPDDEAWLTELAKRARIPKHIGSRIEARLRRLRIGSDPAGPRGFCHGDFRCGNVRISGERVTLFDFDDCGLGPQWYDLATMGWWLETSTQWPRSAAAWAAFVRAYFDGPPQDPKFARTITHLIAQNEIRAACFLVGYCELTPDLSREVMGSLDRLTKRAVAARLHIFANHSPAPLHVASITR